MCAAQIVLLAGLCSERQGGAATTTERQEGAAGLHEAERPGGHAARRLGSRASCVPSDSMPTPVVDAALGRTGAGRGVYASCAIVGSGPALLTGHAGREIDSHEMVMRFNAAPVGGFEAHVGAKTTVRMINNRAARNLLRAAAGRKPADWCPRYVVLINQKGTTDPSLRPRSDVIRTFTIACKPYTPAIVWIYPLIPMLAPLKRLKIKTARSVMSGPIAIALAQLLCRGGIDLYGFSAANSTSLLANGYSHYYQLGCHGSNGADGAPDASAELLAAYARDSNGCLRLRVPAQSDAPLERLEVPRLAPGGERQGRSADPFVDDARASATWPRQISNQAATCS
jgi:hypothetical protein